MGQAATEVIKRSRRANDLVASDVDVIPVTSVASTVTTTETTVKERTPIARFNGNWDNTNERLRRSCKLQVNGNIMQLPDDMGYLNSTYNEMNGRVSSREDKTVWGFHISLNTLFSRTASNILTEEGHSKKTMNYHDWQELMEDAMLDVLNEYLSFNGTSGYNDDWKVACKLIENIAHTIKNDKSSVHIHTDTEEQYSIEGVILDLEANAEYNTNIVVKFCNDGNIKLGLHSPKPMVDLTTLKSENNALKARLERLKVRASM